MAASPRFHHIPINSAGNNESAARLNALVTLMGAQTVAVLAIDGKPIKGSEEIAQFFIGKFLYPLAIERS